MIMEPMTDRGWRVWLRIVERVVVFLGSIGLVALMVLIVFAIARGEPDHTELEGRLDVLEQKVDFVQCLLVTGPDRSTGEIAECQQAVEP